jgi:hypothetical protein
MMFFYIKSIIKYFEKQFIHKLIIRNKETISIILNINLFIIIDALHNYILLINNLIIDIKFNIKEIINKIINNKNIFIFIFLLIECLYYKK